MNNYTGSIQNTRFESSYISCWHCAVVRSAFHLIFRKMFACLSTKRLGLQKLFSTCIQNNFRKAFLLGAQLIRQI